MNGCILTSPQLMEIPSLALSPVAPVRFSLSEPAKSTKWNFPLSDSQSLTSVEDERLPLSPSPPSVEALGRGMRRGDITTGTCSLVELNYLSTQLKECSIYMYCAPNYNNMQLTYQQILTVSNDDVCHHGLPQYCVHALLLF